MSILQEFLIKSAGFIPGAISATAPYVAGGIIGTSSIKPYTSAPSSSQSRDFNKLKTLIENDGINVDTAENPNIPGPGYDGISRTIYYPQNNVHGIQPHAGILAHEYGHALNSRDIQNVSGTPGRYAFTIGSGLMGNMAPLLPLGALALTSQSKFNPYKRLATQPSLRHSKNKFIRSARAVFNSPKHRMRFVGRAGLLGAALQLPRLADEVIASKRGADTLATNGIEGNPYAGLPSYISGLAAPLAVAPSYKLSRKLVKFLPKTGKLGFLGRIFGR